MRSLLLSSGSWYTQGFVCALQDWSLCYPQSRGRPIIKSHWPSRSDSLGIPRPFVWFPGLEAWYGAQNFHNSGKTSLVLSFSSCGHQLHGNWIWFYCDCTPPIISLRLLLVFPWGCIFLVGSSVLLSMVAQQLVAILVFSQEEMNAQPSTLPSWNRCLCTAPCKENLLLTCPFLFLLPVLLVSNPKLSPKPTSRNFFPMLSLGCCATSSF